MKKRIIAIAMSSMLVASMLTALREKGFKQRRKPGQKTGITGKERGISPEQGECT